MSHRKSRVLHILTSEDHNYIYKLDELKQMGAGLPADWASEEKKMDSSTAESHNVRHVVHWLLVTVPAVPNAFFIWSTPAVQQNHLSIASQVLAVVMGL